MCSSQSLHLVFCLGNRNLLDYCVTVRCKKNANFSALNFTLLYHALTSVQNSYEGKHVSSYSTLNQFKQTSSSGRTQALIPSWNHQMSAIICGGTPMRVSTCHIRVRSTVSYTFWRSMKHMKRDTPAFHPIFCSLRTTNTMSVVERSGRNPHCSSGNSLFASQ